jgi:hypothetical protein
VERIDDLDGHGRHYFHPETGHRYPSVTNVLDCIPKQQFLVPWAAKIERELVVDTACRVFSSLNGDHCTPEMYRERLRFALPRKKAHRMALEKAGDIGSEAHALIEWRLRGELGLSVGPEPQPSEPAMWAVGQFEDWRKEFNFKPSHCELRLFSEELDCAGSTDAIACELDAYRYGVLRRLEVIADWKSSRSIYSEHLIQVAVYRHMAIERGILDQSAWGLVLRLPKTLPDKFEQKLVPPSECERLVEVFKAARVIWGWKNKA